MMQQPAIFDCLMSNLTQGVAVINSHGIIRGVSAVHPFAVHSFGAGCEWGVDDRTGVALEVCAGIEEGIAAVACG